MRDWSTPASRSLLAGLLGCAVWLAAPAPATAQQQQSCPTQGGVYTCSVATGQYSSGISFSAGYASNDTVLPISVTAAGDITSTGSSALSVSALGTSELTGAGDTAGMVVSNTGSLTVEGQNPTANAIYGLYAAMVGGVNNPGGNAYSNGSQPLTLSNSGAITINLQGVESSGGSALYALAQGGNAEGGDPASGAGLWGGSAGSVILANTGTISIGSISAPLVVQQGYGGIEALALGGNGATDTAGNTGSAGNSGNATVTSWAPVTVNLNWQNATSNSRAYGILAQSMGGNGALSPTDDNGGNGSNGGNGGFGFLAAVTLYAGADVSVVATGTAPPPPPSGSPPSTQSPSAGVAAAIFGGDGGQAQQGYQAYGGSGGYVSQASITVTDANVTTSGDSLPGLLIYEQGGAGGDGGVYPSGTCGTGGNSCHSYQNGGAGGDAGPGGQGNNAATIQVTAATAPVTISTAGTDSPAVAALVRGGAGGFGGFANIISDTYGGVGGDGGVINSPILIQLTGGGRPKTRSL